MAEEETELQDSPTAIPVEEKIKGLVVGGCFIGMLMMSGYWLVTKPLSGGFLRNFTPLFVSLFIGISSGHYFGKAVIENGEIKKWVALGAFLIAAVGWGAYMYTTTLLFSSLSLVLILGLTAVALGHDVEFIQNNDDIEELIDLFAERISPIGLTGIILIEIVATYLPDTITILGKTTSVGNLALFAVTIVIGIPLMLALLGLFLEKLGLEPDEPE